MSSASGHCLLSLSLNAWVRSTAFFRRRPWAPANRDKSENSNANEILAMINLDRQATVLCLAADDSVYLRASVRAMFGQFGFRKMSSDTS